MKENNQKLFFLLHGGKIVKDPEMRFWMSSVGKTDELPRECSENVSLYKISKSSSWSCELWEVSDLIQDQK